MEKYLNTSLSADCSSRVYDCGRRPLGASTCRQILPRWPLTSLEVLWQLQTPGTCLRGVPSSRTAPPPAPGGGKRMRRVYTDGILLWLWPILGLSSRDDMHYHGEAVIHRGLHPLGADQRPRPSGPPEGYQSLEPSEAHHLKRKHKMVFMMC